MEYSLLIAVGVSALVVMQYYFSRSVQGLIKQNVDNLGGEKLTEQQYTPGKWYGATSTTRISTSGFDYEGRKGFSVSTGSMQRSQVSKITGTTDASELAEQKAPYSQSLVSGDTDLVNSVAGSSVDPGIANVTNNVNNSTANWSTNSTTTDPIDDDPSTGVDSQATSTVDNQVDENDVNSSLNNAENTDQALDKGLDLISDAQRNLQNYDQTE